MTEGWNHELDDEIIDDCDEPSLDAAQAPVTHLEDIVIRMEENMKELMTFIMVIVAILIWMSAYWPANAQEITIPLPIPSEHQYDTDHDNNWQHHEYQMDRRKHERHEYDQDRDYNEDEE